MSNRSTVFAGLGLAVLLGAAVAAAATTATIGAASKAPYGSHLVTSGGQAVYAFTADHSGTSACEGACAKVWPPVMTSGAPMAGAGVTASMLGTIKRTDGLQVTYDGKPLYTFIRDTSPGMTVGEGINHFGGSWYLVSPSGQNILKTAAAKSNGSW